MKTLLFPLVLFLTLLTACETFDQGPSDVAYNDLLLATDGQAFTLPGSDILNAKLLIDPTVDGGYKIIILLSKEGTAVFADATEKALDKQLSISAAGRTILSATVMTPISDGRIVVSGYQRDEAKRIIDALIDSHPKKVPARPPLD
jgi:hypothetical protein